MQQKHTLLRAVSALIFAAGIATGAQAQKVGTYTGTSDDGGFISLTLTESGGVFTAAGMNVNFMANCTHPTRTTNEGWGFFLGQTLTTNDNDFHSGNHYYDISGTFHFPGSKTIKGTITSVTSVFVPGNDPPTAAQFCKSAKQPFTLTFQSAPTRNQKQTATTRDAAILETRRTQ
jgi:hypothetical protein